MEKAKDIHAEFWKYAQLGLGRAFLIFRESVYYYISGKLLNAKTGSVRSNIVDIMCFAEFNNLFRYVDHFLHIMDRQIEPVRFINTEIIRITA